MKKAYLEALHETTLHVTSLSGLDGGIDETLATGHGVEEELARHQTSEEGVGHESLNRYISIGNEIDRKHQRTFAAGVLVSRGKWGRVRR